MHTPPNLCLRLKKLDAMLLFHHPIYHNTDRPPQTHKLRAIAPPHIFILQNCDRLFNRPQNFP
ncbi:hypothetical protein [Cylindrospermopsis raciborskii]|uniref:hypothetical protein n=1 Tax=Cylindrospermopsis raciborskii TaxID=77022 RepID=UPI0022CA8621|nr:hypothetical protein [Cylindrospermopsis raciborskii]MCZ2207817.1 hypothetical protein [Cylindrospermopsis raciborskii PAMP2011]